MLLRVSRNGSLVRISNGFKTVEVPESALAQAAEELSVDHGISPTKDDITLMAFTDPKVFGGKVVAARPSVR